MADWRDSVDNFFAETKETKQNIEDNSLVCFIRNAAVPAFEDLTEQLGKHGRRVTIRSTGSSVSAVVHHGGIEEMSYRIHGRLFPHGVLPYAEVRFRERKGLKIICVESMLRSGTPDYPIEDLKREEVINHFLSHYMRAVKPG